MIPRPIRLLLAVTLAVSLAACGGVRFAPVSEPPSNRHLPGKFVWHDLITPDVDDSKAFYGKLFGWQFETRDGYTLIRNDGRAIGGMVAAGRASDPRSARWLLSLSVRDVDEAVDGVRQAGGKLLRGPMDLPPRGRFALVSDNRGAQLGLLRSASGDPPDTPPAIGDWLWAELWSNDLQASLDFYRALLGYRAERLAADVRGVPYRVLSIDGKWRAGIGQIPWENVHDQWIPYVRVADVAATMARAEALGGEVYLKPQPGAPAMALIADPGGAILMIERWDETPSAVAAPGEGRP